MLAVYFLKSNGYPVQDLGTRLNLDRVSLLIFQTFGSNLITGIEKLQVALSLS